MKSKCFVGKYLIVNSKPKDKLSYQGAHLSSIYLAFDDIISRLVIVLVAVMVSFDGKFHTIKNCLGRESQW